MTAIFAFLQYLKVSISERHTIFSRSLLCLDQPAHHFCTMIEVRQSMPELWHKIWAQKLMTQIKKFWKCSERCQLKTLFRKPPSLKVTFKSKFAMFRARAAQKGGQHLFLPFERSTVETLPEEKNRNFFLYAFISLIIFVSPPFFRSNVGRGRV